MSSVINLNSSLPAAPAGSVLLPFQADPVTSEPRNVSVSVPLATESVKGIATLGIKIVSTQFDKSADTTLEDVTGLSADLELGTYVFASWLFIRADLTGGCKVSVSGTASPTLVIYSVEMANEALSASPTLVMTSASPTVFSRALSLNIAYSQVGVEAVRCHIKGTIVVVGAGTLTIQFAQEVSNGTSSVLAGSSLQVFGT